MKSGANYKTILILQIFFVTIFKIKKGLVIKPAQNTTITN